MTSPLYAVLRAVLLGATAAMIALHLITGKLLKAGVRGVTLLRWEAAYYALLLAAVAAGMREVLIPAVALGAIHLAGWVYGEKKLVHGASALRGNLLIAVQIFDWGEAVALAWIGMMVWKG